jgi:hypothetical protein
VNQTYELQCARLLRNEWKRTAGKMYDLIKAGEVRDAEAVYEDFAFKFTAEDR